MNPPPSDSNTFHDSQAAARRQLHPRDQLWDRLNGPSAIVSALLLLGTFVYVYGPTIGLDQFASSLGSLAWDGLIFATPAPLLNAVDSWLNPPLFPRPMIETQQNSTHAAKSETMRRVLGLDRSSGVMATVFRARSRAFSATGSVLGLKLDTERPAGLGNRDNSCYQNSILQSLSALRTFPDYLAASLRNIDDEGAGKDVAQTLRTLISELNDSSNNGRTLWTPRLLKSMSSWSQQDAQEYYSKILDDIDKGVAAAAKTSQRHQGFEAENCKDDTTGSQHSDDSGYLSQSSGSKNGDSKLARNPLEGLLAQRVSCVQCGHSDGLSMIPFNCLTLSLGLDKNQHDLYERLDSYSKVESIEGVECPKCTLLKAQRLLTKYVASLRTRNSPEEELAEPLRRLEAVETALEEDEFDEKTIVEKCKITTQGKVTTTKTKQIVIARPPQSLAVHMQRSVFDPATFNMMKNSAPVNFPMTLDLGPWCLGSAEDTTSNLAAEKTLDINGDTEEQWVLDPKESMIAGDVRPSRLTGPIYELRAAVTHAGRHENGHYICYRKHPGQAPAPEPLEKGANPADEAIDEGIDEGLPEKTETEAKPPTVTRGNERDMDWWRLSDHNVSRVDESDVLNLSPGVFMLFYDCVDPTMVLHSETEEMHDVTDGTDALTLASQGRERAFVSGTEEPDAPGLEQRPLDPSDAQPLGASPEGTQSSMGEAPECVGQTASSEPLPMDPVPGPTNSGVETSPKEKH